MQPKHFCILLSAVLLALPAAATTYRVYDSGTTVSQPVVPMKWRQLAPGKLADNTVEARLLVAAKLNVSPWLGKTTQVYMTLAPVQQPVQVHWQTQGRFLAGSLAPGTRTLVYAGPIGSPYLEETLNMDITADGRALVNTQSLQFGFEIDVAP